MKEGTIESTSLSQHESAILSSTENGTTVLYDYELAKEDRIKASFIMLEKGKRSVVNEQEFAANTTGTFFATLNPQKDELLYKAGQTNGKERDEAEETTLVN